MECTRKIHTGASHLPDFLTFRFQSTHESNNKQTTHQPPSSSLHYLASLSGLVSLFPRLFCFLPPPASSRLLLALLSFQVFVVVATRKSWARTRSLTASCTMRSRQARQTLSRPCWKRALTQMRLLARKVQGFSASVCSMLCVCSKKPDDTPLWFSIALPFELMLVLFACCAARDDVYGASRAEES